MLALEVQVDFWSSLNLIVYWIRTLSKLFLTIARVHVKELCACRSEVERLGCLQGACFADPERQQFAQRQFARDPLAGRLRSRWSRRLRVPQAGMFWLAPSEGSPQVVYATNQPGNDIRVED